jgi:outer membrane receptor for ferrienterochelin and colicins
MTIMKTDLLTVAAALALALGAAHAACAQSIDHGALEQLFNEPVTTSATGSPQRATDVPVDMSIITADDIKRSGAIDLPTILSRVAGIDVLNWSAGDADLSVRGYNQAFSPRLLVLVDGREIYLDDYGRTAWSNLPVTLTEIRQIEVVRGPNSALFGFNAVGGVINIITYNPKYDDINTVEVHGGTQDGVGGSLVKTLRLGDLVSIRLSAGADRQDEWRNTADLAPVWNAHFMADAMVQLAPTTELRLQGSGARSVETDFYGSDDPGTTTTSSIMATITSDTPYGQIQVQSYLNTLNYRIFIEATDPRVPGIGAVNPKNQVEVTSLQDLFKIGTRSTIRIAIEYRDSRENTSPINGAHVSYGVLSPSAMWDFAATSRLSLTAAARLDHLSLERTGPEPQNFFYNRNAEWNRTIDSFSANLGAVYKISELDTWRATFARGIQLPSLEEFGGFQAVIVPGPFPISLGGNPTLQPAVVSNYQLSYDRILQALNAKASVKVFFQQTNDIIGTVNSTSLLFVPPPGTGAEGVFANASNSTMTGFELAASGKIRGGFHWSADTTYTHVTDKVIGDNNLIGRQVAFADTTPKFRGNVAAGWSDASWAADIYAHYVTAYDAYDSVQALERTPAYASLAARVAYQLPKGWTAAVSGQNLGAPQQAQGLALGLQAPRRVIFSLTKSW